MRYVRYQAGEQAPEWGVIEQTSNGESVRQLSHAPWDSQAAPTDPTHLVSDVRLVAPVVPSKIVAVGRNYADHASELGLETAEAPRIFFKPPSSVVGSGDAILLPPREVSSEVHYEAELAIVIGTACRTVPAGEALSVIFGYTCANDVTARDIQRRDGTPDYAKSFDTFCPLGVWIETEVDLAQTRVRCLVNGEVRQDGAVSRMLTSVPDLVAYVSTAMTLLPGDVVLTGTPAGVGSLQAGDEVIVEIEGVGQLTNTVQLAKPT